MANNKQTLKKTKKVQEFNFIAHDYQKIGNIIYVGDEFSMKGLSKEEKKTETRRIMDVLLDDILIKSLEKIQRNIEHSQDSVVIGCSEIRRQKMNKGKLSIFMKNDEIHTKYSRINGVIGAVSVEIPGTSVKVIEGGKEISISETRYPIIRVNIRILSRLDCGSVDFIDERDEKETSHFCDFNQQNIKSYFATTMLTYGMVDNFNSDVRCDESNLFDFLLIDLFEKKLEEACVKGIYKTYRQFEGNDDRIKGSIDISRHIKTNMGQQNGRVSYKYRENTINNYLNMLIIKTYQHIKKKYPDLIERKVDRKKQVRDLITQLEYEVDKEAISLNTVMMKNLRPIAHPFFSDYEEVRQICLRILRNEGASIFDTSNADVNGFLYYLPDLWEEYLTSIFVSVLNEGDMNNYKIDEQVVSGFVSKKDNSDLFLCESRPDFVFYYNDNPMLILDAKMKPGWKNVIKEPLFKQEYLGEDINKCIRDMEVFGANGTGVVFPWGYDAFFSKELEDYDAAYSDELIRYKRKISNYSSKSFYVIPYRVPCCFRFKSYNDWKMEFNKSGLIFKKIVVYLLTNESLSGETN